MEIIIKGNKIHCEKCGHVTEWSYDPIKDEHIGEKCENCGEDLLKEVDKRIFKPLH